MDFTFEQIKSRKPVWIAFSDLFLDTDVTLIYDEIAQICSESEYSIAELKEILTEEVAPVVSGNLLSIAGEWAGFNEEWLVKQITKPKTIFKSKAFYFFKPRNFGLNGYIRGHWKVLEPKILACRGDT
ncbi:DUF7079 family protein [Shewanella gelidii]|uniref:DUF7079 domain-containing protein n=1 Tax=Shewanella gelidii TaxID=1642821 RepID=A0A917JZA2_9GAMM|nr:hypothetical protein [Shewanella gelidii]MCL1098543.1 hypothetical protein [Shewanella gelidii]GGI93465.1 hypothetical protein GCM10009332_33390 [Shewanella gelidii]